MLRDEACTACRITFPRSDLNALLTGPPLASCPNCRRLLVIPD
ncbi:MAG: C4-type zinc ribbon domain-containing protein [Nitriliruptoraceae bacterium]